MASQRARDRRLRRGRREQVGAGLRIRSNHVSTARRAIGRAEGQLHDRAQQRHRATYVERFLESASRSADVLFDDSHALRGC